MKIKIGSLLNEPYHIINLCFTGIILLVFIYSGIFSAEKNNHPIQSACAKIEGHPCKSEGLSRSFSEIVRFRFDSAKSFNENGIKVFMFFFIQLFLRVLSSIMIIKKILKQTQMIIMDSIILTIIYLYCFWGIIV